MCGLCVDTLRCFQMRLSETYICSGVACEYLIPARSEVCFCTGNYGKTNITNNRKRGGFFWFNRTSG